MSDVNGKEGIFIIETQIEKLLKDPILDAKLLNVEIVARTSFIVIVHSFLGNKN